MGPGFSKTQVIKKNPVLIFLLNFFPLLLYKFKGQANNTSK